MLDRRVFYPTGGGHGVDQVDLQPCSGTQVARTGEIGALRLGKIEKKGRRDLSLSVHLAG